MNRDDLVKALEHIGWNKISEMNGYAYQMKDHEGNKSKVLLKSDHVEIREGEAEACFYYRDCGMDILDNNCVSLAQRDSNSVFVNFYGSDTTDKVKGGE